MSLAGATVVVCRAADRAGPLIRALGEAGARPVLVPMLEIAPPEDGGAALATRLGALDGVAWLTLTSAYAVDAVATALDGAPPSAPIAVVGRATAAAAEAHGWTVGFVPSEATAAGLAVELPVEAGDRVVAPMAEEARPDLAAGLSSRGVDVEVVVAYRNHAPDVSAEALAEIAAADAVLVTSPSTIDRLLELTDGPLPALIAIGPTSAAAVERHGLAVAATADEPSVAGLVGAVTRSLAP